MTAMPDPMKQTDSAVSPFVSRNREAVKRYLKAVVIADNEPVVSTDNDQVETGGDPAILQQAATSSATVRKQPSGSNAPVAAAIAGTIGGLLGGPQLAAPVAAITYMATKNSENNKTTILTEVSADVEKGRQSSHTLNIQSVTNAFAGHGMICGTYLPETDTPDQDIKETLTRLVASADAAILDWQIGSTRGSEFQPTVDAIAAVLKQDQKEGGRLRLIVIYTAENDLDTKRNNLKTLLEEQQVTDLTAKTEDSFPLLAKDGVRIVFCNKINTREETATAIPPEDLQEFVIAQFEILSRGLLRAYALSCVAAVRENSSRLMAQYRPELDGAFVAQRASSLDPDDATDMMHDIMQSDLSAILWDSALDDHLSGKACVEWFTHSGLPEKSEIIKRIQQGSSSPLPGPKKSAPDIHEYFYTHPADAKTQRKAMARMSVYAQAQTPSLLRKTSERPTLSLGTLLQAKESDRYALCIVPRCDSVRLDSEAYNVFPFIALQSKEEFKKLPEKDSKDESEEKNEKEENTEKFFLITPDDTEKPYLILKDKKISRTIFGLSFAPDSKTQTVRATEKDGEFIFTDLDGTEWQWVGTLWEMVAQNIVASVCNALNRVGLNEHEWLRSRKQP